jgi:hypothetical protein
MIFDKKNKKKKIIPVTEAGPHTLGQSATIWSRIRLLPKTIKDHFDCQGTARESSHGFVPRLKSQDQERWPSGSWGLHWNETCHQEFRW